MTSMHITRCSLQAPLGLTPKIKPKERKGIFNKNTSSIFKYVRLSMDFGREAAPFEKVLSLSLHVAQSPYFSKWFNWQENRTQLCMIVGSLLQRPGTAEGRGLTRSRCLTTWRPLETNENSFFHDSIPEKFFLFGWSWKCMGVSLILSLTLSNRLRWEEWL